MGIALLVGLTLGWGLTWPIMKIGVLEVPPTTFRALTTPLAALLMLLIMFVSRVPLRLPEGRWGVLILGSLLNMVAWFMLMTFGILLMDTGEAAIIAYTMPLWAAILGALILKERLSGRPRRPPWASDWPGSFCLAPTSSPRSAPPPSAPRSCCWPPHRGQREPLCRSGCSGTCRSLAVTTWQLLLATPPMIAAGLIFRPDVPANFSPGAIFSIAYIVLVSHAYCFTAWYKIIRLVPANVSALSVLMIPAVGVISGALILGEVVGWREWVALALVSQRRRPNPDRPRPALAGWTPMYQQGALCSAAQWPVFGPGGAVHAHVA